MSTNQSPRRGEVITQTADELATTILAAEAEQWVVDQAAALVAAGTHEWVLDPQVDGPIGLVRKGTNIALVIVYPGERPDFETSLEFELLGSGAPKEA